MQAERARQQGVFDPKANLAVPRAILGSALRAAQELRAARPLRIVALGQLAVRRA